MVFEFIKEWEKFEVCDRGIQKGRQLLRYHKMTKIWGPFIQTCFTNQTK